MYKNKAVPFTTRDKNRPQPSSKHPPKSGRWSRDSKQVEKTPKAATTAANSLKKPKGKVIKVKNLILATIVSINSRFLVLIINLGGNQ